MKKAFFVMMLVVLLGICLVACKRKNSESTSGNNVQSETNVDKDGTADETTNEGTSDTTTSDSSAEGNNSTEEDGFPEIEDETTTQSDSNSGATTGSNADSDKESNEGSNTSEKEETEEKEEKPAYVLPIEPDPGNFSPGIL